MTRAVFLLLLLLVWPRPGVSAPEVELRIGTEAREIEPGRAFEVTVVRTWEAGWVPDPWNPATLAPLLARPVGDVQLRGGERVAETRRFRCYAFSLEDVTVPSTEFRARSADGATEMATTGNELVLRVRPSLDPAAPGAAEPPGGLLSQPRSWGAEIAGAVLGLLGLAALGFYLRRRSGGAVAVLVTEAPAPSARALARLNGLRTRQPHSRQDLEAFYLEASGAVRDYVGERFQLATAEKTTAELVGCVELGPAVTPPLRTRLAGFLRHCDLVKYGDHRPSVPDREHWLREAESFVVQTDPPATLPPPGASP